MTISADRWESLGDYLSTEGTKLLSNSGRGELAAIYEEIRADEEKLDDVLLIGIVGGTGVGKSTFINALAGREISRSSDRRPMTDRVIVYRHLEVELPSGTPPEHLSQPQVLHEHDRLRGVTLLDFPDFDSAESGHREILERYLPHLDVLLVVVEDMKYGDRRLYELLRGIDHDPRNLYVLFNKVDRLAKRYGDECPRIVAELIDDLVSKLRDYAATDLDRSQIIPISALRTFEERIADAPAAPGDFSRVEVILDSFREDKRRREAKQLNIDSRKDALLDALRASALSEDNLDALREIERMSRRWRDDLGRAVEGLTGSFFSTRHRRYERTRRMRETRSAWGVPFSLFLTFLGEWRRFNVDAGGPCEITAARLAQHFRPYFDALGNMTARLEDELDASGIEVSTFDHGDLVAEWSSSAVDAVDEKLNDWKTPTAKQRWAVQIPPVGTLLLFLWSSVYPAVDALFDANEETGFWRALRSGLLGALNPVFLVSMIVTVAVVYVLTGVLLWLKTLQSVDDAMSGAEKAARASAEDAGLRALEGLIDRVRLIEAERSRLEELLED